MKAVHLNCMIKTVQASSSRENKCSAQVSIYLVTGIDLCTDIVADLAFSFLDIKLLNIQEVLEEKKRRRV